MRLGLELGMTRNGTRAPFRVSFTGLSDDSLGPYGRIGTHASIGYTIAPSLPATVKWSADPSPAAAATFGTGANPTAFAAADGFAVFLHVTADPDDAPDRGPLTVTRAFQVRHAPGTGSSVPDQNFTVGEAVDIAAAASGANLVFTDYVASGLPEGLTINAATGQITGTPTAAGSGTAIIGPRDQYGRRVEYQDSFTWTVPAVEAGDKFTLIEGQIVMTRSDFVPSHDFALVNGQIVMEPA